MMRRERIDPRQQKGWALGPWNSGLDVALGWAMAGIDVPHLHARMTEIYLIARGTAVARVERETIALTAGDLLIVEPGEAHTFLDSSDEPWHFVVHTPALPPAEARADHAPVARDRLGLG